MKALLPGWHLLKVNNGTLRYRGRDYDLSGARASMENTGWRGQKHAIVVDGPRYQLRLPVIKYRVTAAKITEAINNEAFSAPAKAVQY